MNNRLLSVLIKAQQIAEVSDDDTLFIPRQTLPPPTHSNTNQTTQADPEKPKNWKKPKDMPRRPLSAYNLFFKSERQRMISSSSSATKNKSSSAPKGKRGKSLGIGFAGMARTIGGKWKTIPSAEKSVFEAQARIEKARYHKEMVVWRMKEATKKVALKDAALKKKQEEAASLAVMAGKPSMATPGHCDTSPLKQSSFDASDMRTGQSLDALMKNMQEASILSCDRTQLYDEPNAMSEKLDPISRQSCSSSRSIFQPFDLTLEDLQEDTQQRRDCSSTYEPVPMSCWRALASPSSMPSSNHYCPNERFPEGGDDLLLDDLSLFMNVMEHTDW